MVVDTSALLAILQDEPEREACAEAIASAPSRCASAATLVEASMVMESRYGAVGIQDLDQLLETARIEIVAVDRQQANAARRAFRDFGRGRHPAGLDYGDCFSYALARVRGERLLAKGDDFTKTDLPMVPLYRASAPTPAEPRATLDGGAVVPPGIEASVELNGVAYRLPAAPVAVVCVDGGDPEYLTAAAAAGLIPTIERFMRQGFSATAHSVVPSFTGPNNMSIATGAPPAVHGISGNFFLDRQTGRAVEMTGPDLLRSRTIFDVMSKAGVRTAVVTAKDKLRRQLGRGLAVGAGNVCFSSQHADRCTAAEHGIDDALGFVGQPLPDMYSPELSLFVLDAGIRFLEQDDPPRLLYLTLTDYVQHTFAPDHPQALEFYRALDRRLARLEELGATVAVTADHGMRDKCAPDGSYRIIYLQDLLDQRFGAGAARVICPITDAFVAHHGSLGSFVRVYCYDAPVRDAIDFMRSIGGIELVLGREEAAAQFELPLDVEGDAVAISTKTHCIGMGRADHDLGDLHGARLRTHGGIAEREVPFILSRPLNHRYQELAESEPLMNYRVIEFALNGVA
ncbi:MAG: phosphonoacetate hydrolase [Spirochaetaceae bacterium]|nr:phosphonoacetate hydrolase [Spirochaetaceae bacterium]